MADEAQPAPNECTPDDPTDGGLTPAPQSNPEDFGGYPAGWVAPPHGLASVVATYGSIQVASGQIVAPRGWESENMVAVTDLPGWPRKLYCNKAIVPPLRLALQRCVGLLDGYVVRTMGSFAPRPKRVNGDLSVHSWGAAVDINADANPLASAPGMVVPCGNPGRDMPDAWVSIFESIGWTWGGRFTRADPMHFQWCSGY